MPPRAKITKEMIVDTAFQIVRKEGASRMTARSISEHLNCSTQPVLYYFSTIEDIKKSVYIKADEYHTAYISHIENDCANPMLAIGMNYIKFALEEKYLFRFLFQSDEFSGRGMLELLETEELLPIVTLLQKEAHLSLEDAVTFFKTLFIFVHGYASLYANNAMIYTASDVSKMLEKVFNGIACTVKKEKA